MVIFKEQPPLTENCHPYYFTIYTPECKRFPSKKGQIRLIFRRFGGDFARFHSIYTLWEKIFSTTKYSVDK